MKKEKYYYFTLNKGTAKCIIHYNGFVRQLLFKFKLKAAIKFRLENTFTIKHCGESTTGMNEFYCRFEKPPFTPPATPTSPTHALQIREDDVRQVFKKSKTRKEPGPDGDTSLSEILCWPAGPHLHTDLQQITGGVWSPLMLQTLHHHPQRRPKETQNYWT